MLIPFPTRPRPHHIGFPFQADACMCDVPLPDEPGGTCVRCGRYEAPIIASTWHRRALELAA